MPNNVYLNPMNEWIQETKPKPNEGYKERIKQAQRVNAVAQVLNLISQGAYGAKGARINPMVDQITPFALNEFGRMRQEEIASGEKERQYGLDALTKQIDYNVQEERIQKSDATKERHRNEDRERKMEDDEKFRLTKEEHKALEQLKAAIQVGKQKEIMQYANELNILSEKRKEEREREKTEKIKPIFYIDQKYPVTDVELNSLSDKLREILNTSPEYYERLKAKLPAITLMALKHGEGTSTTKISPKDWQAIFTELKDEIAPYYNELIKNTRESNQTMTYMETSPSQNKNTNKVDIDAEFAKIVASKDSVSIKKDKLRKLLRENDPDLTEQEIEELVNIYVK
jgi:hypothetical protein